MDKVYEVSSVHVRTCARVHVSPYSGKKVGRTKYKRTIWSSNVD
jgi:hypothetical protein